jgi:hypothetical protein
MDLRLPRQFLAWACVAGLLWPPRIGSALRSE